MTNCQYNQTYKIITMGMMVTTLAFSNINNTYRLEVNMESPVINENLNLSYALPLNKSYALEYNDYIDLNGEYDEACDYCFGNKNKIMVNLEIVNAYKHVSQFDFDELFEEI